jgi:FkbM family methyltransferase
VMNALELKMGDTVADVGAGTGYFALPMAKLVGPTGTVHAVDVQPEMLEILRRKLSDPRLANVECWTGEARLLHNDQQASPIVNCGKR